MVLHYILELPPEILEKILEQCDKQSLQKFAACSKKSNHLLAYKLYEKVRIDYSHISRNMTIKEENFGYTKCLSIISEYEYGENWKNALHNFSRIISSCNPSKLTVISLHKFSIPTEDLELLLKRFENLNVITLDDYAHGITQSIFIRLTDLKKLDKLLLDHCFIFEDVPLYSSLNVKTLSIKDCGFIREENISCILQMANLKHLTLSYNYEHSDNYLTVSFENLKELSCLESLDLTKSLMYSADELNDVLLRLQSLKRFCVPDSPLTGIIEAICKLPLLTHLTLNGYFTSNEDLKVLKGLTTLRYLKVRGCGHVRRISGRRHNGRKDVNDSDLAHIGDMVYLQELDLSRNTTITDEGIKYLTTLSSLKKLNISYCTTLSDRCLVHLGILPSLRRLVIHGNDRTKGLFSNMEIFSKMALDQMKTLKDWQYDTCDHSPLGCDCSQISI